VLRWPIPWFASSVSGGYTRGSVVPETAPVSPARSAASRSPVDPSRDRPQGVLHRLRAALRFDGLWWRKFARLGCVYGPEWWKRGSPPVIALIIFLLVRRNRQGAIENQMRARGDPRRWRAALAAYRTFATFARCFTETMEFYGPRPRRFQIDEPKRNHVAEALERGRGVILATAHVGNWDISGRALHATGRPVQLVMGREVNETTQEYARRSREQVGMRVIFSDSSVFSAFNMIRALRSNEILAIQIDRGNGEPNSSAKPVEFFGADASFQEGPFHLARLSGAPVVPVVTLRRGLRHYEILLGEPRWVSSDVPGDAERALRQTVAFFETTIRENPEQWFQFAPFWPAAR